MSETLRILAFLILSVPLVVVVAAVASRMLGVRRSWVTVAVAGVIGWTAGFVISLVIAGELQDARLVRNTVVLALVFSMAAMVALDLLAKPGSLAQGEAAGMFVIPRPGRYLGERFDVVRRSREIVEIAHRNGFGPQLGGRVRRTPEQAALERDPAPIRARRTLEQCGGMFVKLGQIASTRTDLLPLEFTEELSRLQSNVAPTDPAAMRALVEEELGASVDEVFADFDWSPIGTASIAQVYRATLRSGEAVVVKAQRPEIAEIVRRDTRVLLRLADLLERNIPLGADYRVSTIAREFAEGVREELDFRGEARNAVAIGANMAGQAGIRVPAVFEHYSTPRLLVQERFDGPPASDAHAIAAIGADPDALADALLRAELKQIMTDGWFHADPHPGNVLVLDDHTLGLIDFGACGRLDPLQQASLRHMLIATALRDATLLRQAVEEACDVGATDADEALERALARFLSRHARPGQAIEASAVSDLMQMLMSFGIDVPIEFTTFARALVVLDGTLTTLSPTFRFSEAATALATEWITPDDVDRAAPVDLESMARDELIAQAPTLRLLPKRVDRVLRMAEKGELHTRTSLFSREEDIRFVSKMVNRAVLAFVGALLAVVSVVLLTSTGGPEFAAEVTLFNLFGYLGLFGGVVLLMRVVAAIVREGLN